MRTGPKKRSISERFWEKVNKNGPIPIKRPDLGCCWIWTAAKLSKNAGYGVIGTGSRTDGTKRVLRAHIVSYELMIGSIPNGLVLDHLCSTPSCVNPYHLEPVSQKENLRRAGVLWNSKTAPRWQTEKTHCAKGHLYNGDNLYITPRGKRDCRICKREASLRWYRKKEAARCQHAL